MMGPWRLLLCVFLVCGFANLSCDRQEFDPATRFTVKIDAYDGASDYSALEEALRERLKTITRRYRLERSGDLIVVDIESLSTDKLETVRVFLSRPGQISFVRVHPNSSPAMVQEIQGGTVVPGYHVAPPLEPEWGVEEVIEVAPSLKPVIDYTVASKAPVGYVVVIHVDSKSGELLRNLTQEIVGERLALVLDGKIIFTPRVREPFGASFQISGNYTREEAKQLSLLIEQSLPVPISLVSEELLPKTPAGS